MTKTELIKKVAEVTEMPKTHVEPIVTAIFDTIVETVSSDEDVAIHGFGKFVRKIQKGRSGIVPFGENKGTEYKTEDKYVPFFTASKLFKDKVGE